MILEKLRSGTKLILWIVVFAFIAWLFFQLGARISGQRKLKPWQKGVIAQVEGIDIDYKSFEARVNYAVQETLANRENKNITEEEIKRIRDAEFRNLVEEIKWTKFNSEKRHFGLLDNTIYQIMLMTPPDEIKNDTSFYTDGKFDYEKYRKFLNDPKAYPFLVTYGHKISTQLPKEWTIEDLIVGTNFSDNELWELYKRENTRVKVKYLGILLRDIPDTLIKYDEKEVKEYYETHKDKFKEPPKAALKIVQFEVKPTSDDTLTVRDRLETALEIIKEGNTFEELIKDYSEDDGDFGWIKKDDKRKKELFEMLKDKKVGEVVGPVNFGRGLYLFKIEKKTRDSIKVKDIFIAIRASEATKQDIYEKAKEFAELARKKGFEKAAEELKLNVLDTKEFSIDGFFIPYIGFRNEVVKQFIKKSKKGEISDVFYINNKYMVLYLYEKHGETVLPFDDEKTKSKAEKLLVREKKLQLIKENLNVADSLVKAGVSLDSIPSRLKLKAHVNETRYFNWKEAPDYLIGYNPEFNGVAFALEPGKISPPFVIEATGGFIIQVLDKKEPDYKKFEANKEKFASYIKQRIFDALYRDWETRFTSFEDIKDYRNYIYIY